MNIIQILIFQLNTFGEFGRWLMPADGTQMNSLAPRDAVLNYTTPFWDAVLRFVLRRRNRRRSGIGMFIVCGVCLARSFGILVFILIYYLIRRCLCCLRVTICEHNSFILINQLRVLYLLGNSKLLAYLELFVANYLVESKSRVWVRSLIAELFETLSELI